MLHYYEKKLTVNITYFSFNQGECLSLSNYAEQLATLMCLMSLKTLIEALPSINTSWKEQINLNFWQDIKYAENTITFQTITNKKIEVEWSHKRREQRGKRYITSALQVPNVTLDKIYIQLQFSTITNG